MSQLKWGVLLSYLTMGLSILVSLAYTPVMLRLLGQDEWGLYQLVASVVGYLSLLSFGFGGAYIRFYSRAATSEDEGAVARVNGLFLVVFLAIGAIALVAGTTLALNARLILGDKLTAQQIDTARTLIGLMTLTVAISFPASVFSSFVIARERFVFQRILDLIRVLGTPLLALVALVIGYRSVGMAAAAAFVAAAIAIANLAYCVGRIQMHFSFREFDVLLMREIAIFSSFIFINMLVDQVNWNVDKLILGRINGAAEVAVYALAAQLNGYYVSLSGAVSSVFIPRVHRAVAQSSGSYELTRLLARVGRIQFMVLALIASGIVVFGRPFIAQWAGPAFVGAYQIALLLIIPATVPLIQNLGIEIQRAKNMHQFRSWLYVAIAALNIAVSIRLAEKYGGVGAALGTAGALLLGNGVVMNWYYAKRVGLDMGYFWREILRFTPALIPVALLGASISHYVGLESIWDLVVWGVVFAATYCASMWFLGMNEAERVMVRRPIVRILLRHRAHSS